MQLTDKDCDVLKGKKREVFHTVVAKLLYIMKRARQELQTAVIFVCTRITMSNKDNWKKYKE